MNIKFMDEAFKQAQIAYDIGEVPVGVIIVKNNKIIARTHNMKEYDNCCLSHAELIAIKSASKILNNWRLCDCDIYVTLDPCPMCASAIKQSRIKNVYSAGNNSDVNNLKIIKSIFESDSTNPSVNFISNIDKNRTEKLLNDFFIKQRK